MKRRHIVILSPHLDDAMINCAGLVYATQRAPHISLSIVNVFSKSFFSIWQSNAKDFSKMRLREDRTAFLGLSVDRVNLGLPDWFTRSSPLPDDAFSKLSNVVSSLAPSFIFAPASSFGDVDHTLLSLFATKNSKSEELVLYQDFPYLRQVCPLLGSSSFETLPIVPTWKTKRLRSYKSQLDVSFINSLIDWNVDNGGERYFFEKMPKVDSRVGALFEELRC